MKYNRKAVTWEEPSTLHVTATMTTVVDCTGPTAQQGGKAAAKRGSSGTMIGKASRLRQTNQAVYARARGSAPIRFKPGESV